MGEISHLSSPSSALAAIYGQSDHNLLRRRRKIAADLDRSTLAASDRARLPSATMRGPGPLAPSTRGGRMRFNRTPRQTHLMAGSGAMRLCRER
jgi:hypothetical protein